MNAATGLKMNWSKRSAHQWLEQYGAWVRTVKTDVSANPLAVLIDQNDKTRIRASKVSIPVEIRDAMVNSVSNDKILIFDKSGTQLIKEKIFLILFYEKLFLRRCKVEGNTVIFDSDKPEIYSKIIYSGKDVVVLGRLLYSAYLESY